VLVEVHAVPVEVVKHAVGMAGSGHVTVVQMQLLQVVVLLELVPVLVPVFVLVPVPKVQAPVTAQVHPVVAQVQVLVVLAQSHGTLPTAQLLLRPLGSDERPFKLRNVP
jgi:hypothetical protein